ncbi:MAG TPA: iron-containing alcohol dehydrogenase family protein [Mobilitalea sp.]|nr:iron-containing alcohol dehydrogenase family protein [Mobilitalea sp.]
MNIIFFMPTRVIMMENCIQNNAALIKSLGRKALIVTGANSAKSNGSLQDVTDALTGQGVKYCIFDKVMANPTVACVYEGAQYAREHKADFIIGIGGGSPMDAAKAIALLAAQNIPEEELFLGHFTDQALPIALIPTTAGTGSEVTPYSILTNVKAQTKTSISSPLLFPELALLDAKYMKNLSMEITINTALDALSHAIEGMLSVKATEISSSFAVESLKKLVPCLRSLSPEKGMSGSGLTIDIREKLLYGSMLAGIVISHTGTTAVHSMGYSLTYFKNLDHGRANGLLLPSFLRFIMKSDQDIVKKILTVMGLKTIDEFEALFLRLLGEREQMSEKELERFAGIAVNAKNVLNSKVIPTKDDIINIYSRSLQIV